MRITANGVGLAIRPAGPDDGPPLVLLHALGESAADWDHLVAVVRDFLQG